MRRLAALCAVGALLATGPAPSPIFGFTAQGAAAERFDEDLFRDLPSAQGALESAQQLGAQPHYAGTKGDYALAVATRDRLSAYGFDARIDVFRARIDTPRRLTLALYPDGVPPRTVRAVFSRNPHAPARIELREVGEPRDPATENPAVGVPFDAGSADGDVVATLVYANRGTRDDYAALAHGGVDVRGAVVLVRDGAASSGTLAREAQASGATGAILYDDPAHDGIARGATDPDGPWRPPSSVEREQLGAGVRIPVLPVSSEVARTLLRALRGSAAPRGWAGALDAPYAFGRGPAAVHLVVRMNRRMTTLWNTIGVLHGSVSGAPVVLTTRRDAWVYGVDASGTSTVLEAARGLGYLARARRRPRRTIVVALWDGAQSASITQLLRDCVADIDGDAGVTGSFFIASAPPALGPSIIEATRRVPDPARDSATLAERWQMQRGGVALVRPVLLSSGAPMTRLGFAGPFDIDGSSYDTYAYAKTWSDPGFALHRADAQLYGILALRLADADVVPYAFGAYVPPLRAMLAEIASHDGSGRGDASVAALRRAIDVFAVTARRVDAGTARGVGPRDARMLAARRALDGIEGTTTGGAVSGNAAAQAVDAVDGADRALR